MNFRDILTCLEDPEKRNEYIARLKTAGETSQAVLDLKNSMEGVKMNKPPKHIFETTMSQHTFKFCDPLECFLQFRLVCKPWKNAVESIKFDQFPPVHIADLPNHANHPGFVSKFLPMFKKLEIELCDPTFQSEQMKQALLSNIANLNEISIYLGSEESGEPFIRQLYQNSIHTLKKITHLGNFLPDLQFPKVTKVGLLLCTNTKKTFVPMLLDVLKNMEKIKVIKVNIWKSYEDVCDFICQNYSQHCISADYDVEVLLNHFPLKVCEVVCLNDVHDKKYNREIEYLSGYIPDLDDATDGGWDKYEEILDQCTKLKKVALVNDYDIDITCEENDIPKIWKDILAYLKKRGIEIVSPNQILNTDFFDKVAKEVGIKWRFEFSLI